MPIRFRCAYCNQLMGISQRKAGQVVRCPKCAGEIIVPVPEGMDAPPAPIEPPTAGPQAFEDKNFDQAFKEPANAPKVAPDHTANETTAKPEAPPAPTASPPKRLGVFVPLGMLILSFAVIVLLLILMFVLGLIIGRHTVIS